MSSAISTDDDFVETRWVDTSGGLDQRPEAERSLSPSSAALPVVSPLAPAVQSNAVQYAPLPTPVVGKPAKSPAVYPVSAGDLFNRHQTSLNTLAEQAKNRLAGIVRKIEAQEKKCVTPRLDDTLQQLRFQRQKVLVSQGPQLADLLNNEKAAAEDLKQFRQRNRLQHEAHYPASQTLSLSILLVLVLVEAAINGVLFAEASDMGLLGGWMEAMVLAMTNVGAAFLLGRLVLPNLNRRSVLAKVFAGAVALCFCLVILAVNIAGAHYRDFKASSSGAEAVKAVVATGSPAVNTSQVLPANEGRAKRGHAMDAKGPRTPVASSNANSSASGAGKSAIGVSQPQSPTEKDAIRHAIANPLDIQSFTSFFLAVIGLCAAAIAAWDGYKLDDPFPGYGRRHRRYVKARSLTAEGLRRVLHQSNSIVGGASEALNRSIGAYAHEISALQSLGHAYDGERQTLQSELNLAVENAEKSITHAHRLAYKVSAPIADEQFALSTPALPSLNEKHQKSLESHERKLKALQKSAAKEQADILNLFENASADFQKLLDLTGSTSLQAAAGPEVSDAAAQRSGVRST